MIGYLTSFTMQRYYGYFTLLPSSCAGTGRIGSQGTLLSGDGLPEIYSSQVVGQGEEIWTTPFS